MRMDNPDDITWHFLGRGKKKTTGISYERAKVRVKSTGQERVFHLGDAVHVQGGENGCPWIAQIVEFLDTRSEDDDTDDPEVEVVDQYIAAKFKCTLRWIYNPNDVPQACVVELEQLAHKAVSDEFFFSDHVEAAGSNPLEVIEGRAWLAASYPELSKLRQHKPEGWWPNDVLCLVRMFHNNRSNPPKIRYLQNGELKKLLQTPSIHALYSQRSRNAVHGTFQAVMKGTRKKVSSPTSPPRNRSRFRNRESFVGNSSRSVRRIVDDDDEEEDEDLPRPMRRQEPATDSGRKKLTSRREETAKQSGIAPRPRHRVETIEKSGTPRSPPRRRRTETIEDSGTDRRIPRSDDGMKSEIVGRGTPKDSGNTLNIRQPGAIVHQPDAVAVGNPGNHARGGLDGFDPLGDLDVGGMVLEPIDMAGLLGSREGSVPPPPPQPPSSDAVMEPLAQINVQEPQPATPSMDESIKEVMKNFENMEAGDRTKAFRKLGDMVKHIKELQKNGAGDEEQAINQVMELVFGPE